MENIGNNFDEKNLFLWSDYVVFLLSLVLCILIGVYFGFFKVAKNATDYLLGGKSMKCLPVAISMVVGWISAISFVGIPAEIYFYGYHFLLVYIGFVLCLVLSRYLFLPVLNQPDFISIFEYLQRRFDTKCRRLGSILYLLANILWLPIVIYVPSLSLAQVTGFKIEFISLFVCAVCIFYTCIGGLNAVIWTDVLQTILMFCSLAAVIIIGTFNVGGFMNVINLNIEGTRLEIPDFRIDPTIRNSFWPIVIGGFFGTFSSAVFNQAINQRILALPDWKSATKTLWYFIIGIILLNFVFLYMGLLIYATFYKCDPSSAKQIDANDQILSFMVINTFDNIPGFTGLFLAGIFSASLSSLSGALNSFAAIILEDIYKPLRGSVSSKESNILMKTVVVVTGVICVLLSFLANRFGGVIQLTSSLGSIPAGPTAVLFIVGMLMPRINSTAAFWGSIVGLLGTAFISLGTQMSIASGDLHFEAKTISVEQCKFNVTEIHLEEIDFSNEFSYHYFPVISTVISFVAIVIVSWFTKSQKLECINPELLSPIIRKHYYPEKNNSVVIKN